MPTPPPVNRHPLSQAVPFYPKYSGPDRVEVRLYSLDTMMFGEGPHPLDEVRWEPSDNGWATRQAEAQPQIDYLLTLLTPKQQQVALLLLQGYSRTEIWRDHLHHTNKLALHLMIQRMRARLREKGMSARL